MRPRTRPFVVGLGGTTRDGSSTEKALNHALESAGKEGADTMSFLGAELAELPLYCPKNPERNEVASRLIGALRQADGLIIASPSYHGSVSGLMKNALDYVEDLREDERPYFTDRPVGCIATGFGWQGIVSTLHHLRAIVHALRGWPTPLGVGVDSTVSIFDGDEVVDERVRQQFGTLAQEVVGFGRSQLGERNAIPVSLSTTG